MKKKYRALCEVIRGMGMLTASARLRSSGRMGSAFVDYLIGFSNDSAANKMINDYAANYAQTVKENFAELGAEIKSNLATH